MTQALPPTKNFRIAQRAVAILSAAGMGIRESEVFMAAGYRKAPQIAAECGQLLPNTRARLWALVGKGLVVKIGHHYNWSDEGLKIMQRINE